MKKTLYSLMLNDEVVREVDAMAHRLGTNRSNLINEILAEYVNYTTPERRINDILSTIQDLMLPADDLVPFFAPHTYSMSLKSSLAYKYRPTIKYEIELFKGKSDYLGQLSILFRTQSPALVSDMTEFFVLWKSIEDAHLTSRLSLMNEYSIDAGRFVRSIAIPERECSAEELASALSLYVRLFDKLMKGWLAGQYDTHEIEAAYYSFLSNTKLYF